MRTLTAGNRGRKRAPVQGAFLRRKMLGAFVAAFVCACMTFPEGASAMQATMPVYQPVSGLSGDLVIWGDDAFEALAKIWGDRFTAIYPQVHIHTFLRGTSTAVGALYTGTAQVGLFGREIRPLEIVSWKRIFSYPPLGFTIATGSYDVFAKTDAEAILVNKSNPIDHISLKQIDAIYSRDRKRGAPARITTWGQLGASGEWASKPIHPYMLDENTGTAQNLQTVVLLNGRWNCDLVLPPGAPGRMYRNSGRDASVALLKTIDEDPYAMGFDSFRNANGNRKALAVSVDKEPAIVGTKESVKDRTYPLSRNLYLFVNKDPAKPWDPKTEEFVRFVLSQQGQDAVAKENDYLPLPPAIVEAERSKLK